MESIARLKYLDAERIHTPAGLLDGAAVFGPSHETLGKLDGVLIDPHRRKVRYCVVEAGHQPSSAHHYLLPLTSMRLVRGERALEVDVDADELSHMDEVEPDDLPRFDESDLRAARTASHGG